MRIVTIFKREPNLMRAVELKLHIVRIKFFKNSINRRILSGNMFLRQSSILSIVIRSSYLPKLLSLKQDRRGLMRCVYLFVLTVFVLTRFYCNWIINIGLKKKLTATTCMFCQLPLHCCTLL